MVSARPVFLRYRLAHVADSGLAQAGGEDLHGRLLGVRRAVLFHRGAEQADHAVKQYDRLQATRVAGAPGQVRTEDKHRGGSEHACHQTPAAIEHTKCQPLGILATPVAGGLDQRRPEQQYGGQTPPGEKEVESRQAG